jgi:4-hydroxy-4-methyl-2-oxoglutarate aldolase
VIEQITLDDIRQHLFSAVVCDALDSIGLSHQSPRIPLRPMTTDGILVGRCKTTLWGEMFHVDPNPYELELKAVDSLKPDDVLIAAAGGSNRSGIWGELLSTAASHRGCKGAIVDGAVRDLKQMQSMGFPVWARDVSLYDSKDRNRVVDIDVPVEMDGVIFSPGDLVIADIDGVVVVPKNVEKEVIALAWKKIHDENEFRDSIKKGMSATEAFKKYGVL